MPIPNVRQEELMIVDDGLRLRAYDGQFELAFDWYQDPDVIYLIDGNRNPYSLKRIQRMYEYLAERGEVYFIEVWEQERWLPIGDVTFWQEDLPIVIGNVAYRGQGIGRKVISALVERGRLLGYHQLAVQEIFDFNQASRRMFEAIGFYQTVPKEKGWAYALDLSLPLAKIQPSQFYLSQDKLDKISIDFEAGEMSPLPIKRLDGKIFFTDGHSRAFKAYCVGLSDIPVYFDGDELNWDFYRYCVQACEKMGIFSIADLQNRILSQSDYQIQWLDWCKKECRKFGSS